MATAPVNRAIWVGAAKGAILPVAALLLITLMVVPTSWRGLPLPVPDALPRASVADWIIVIICCTLVLTLSEVAVLAVMPSVDSINECLNKKGDLWRTERVDRCLQIVVEVGEDGRDILRLALGELSRFGSGNRSRRWDSRRDGAEGEGGKGGDLSEGEHDRW